MSDPCPASTLFTTRPTDGAFYETLTPFEHFDSIRTQRFPNTCSAEEIAGSRRIAIATRSSVADYPSPYNLVTRNRDQLYVYGGGVSEGRGAYLARLAPATLEEVWRVDLRVVNNGHWNYPGVGAVHGNGAVYAVAGNLLAKVNPVSGEARIITLPQHAGQGGAAYNGFDISSGGVIFAKSMERGHPCDADGVGGLACAANNGIPAFLVAVGPRNLRVRAVIETREPIIGRITTERHDGNLYVYCIGVTRVWRYLFKGDTFELDPAWGPVLYAEGGEQPGPGPGLLEDWLIFQTNFLRSKAPLTVWAINIWDSRKVHRIQPFPESTPSQEFSKPALDWQHMRVYTSDQLAGRVAGLDFDPQRGFSCAWQAEQTMASFWALVGDRCHRQLVGTDWTREGDHAIWRDAASGEEVARSAALDEAFNGSIISPGFDGRFYYMAQRGEKVVELTPVARD